MPDFETLARKLTTWASNMSAGTQAAVWLLKEHEHWLRRASFIDAAIVKRGAATAIDWTAARKFLGSDPRGSTSELAILDLAIALGEDRYRFGIMGHAHADMIVRAVWRALGAGDD